MSELPDSELFALSPGFAPRFHEIAPGLPAVIVDDVYLHPRAIRAAALARPFEPASAFYPGRLATFPADHPSLGHVVETIKRFVNEQLMPQIPLLRDGKRVTGFSMLHTDFGVIDTPPGDLAPVQRAPHVDPAPIFGLVYLNETERGGTAFFRKTNGEAAGERTGYFGDADAGFEKVGRIEGRFNRLAIYPGFVWHSAEIGDWIESDERIRSPRLTQRFVFVD